VALWTKLAPGRRPGTHQPSAAPTGSRDLPAMRADVSRSSDENELTRMPLVGRVKARRKKVLWLIKGLGLGGAEKLLALSLPHIDRSRFEYEVAYFLPWKNALVPEFERAGVKVHCLNQKRHFDPRGWLRLVRLLKETKPDLLHMHLPYAAVLGRLALLTAPVPVSLYTEHNVFERYNRLMAFAHSKTYSMNDGVIFVSQAVESSVRDRVKFNGRPKGSVIWNGIDIAQIDNWQGDPSCYRKEFGIPVDAQVIVTVANFTPKKRHEDLLRAARQVVDVYPTTRFVLVGSGPLESRLRRLTRELGLQHHVIFTGSRADAIGIVAASDIFVLPSKFEALGIALLEAMALRKPTIATHVGGIPEVIEHGKTGYLVPPLDPGRLAGAIMSLLEHPGSAAEMGVAGRARVIESFDIRKMVSMTESRYVELLSDRGVTV